MKRFIAVLVTAIGLIAGVSNSRAEQLIPQGTTFHCDSTKPLYFKRQGDKRNAIVFDYTHYGFKREWNRNYNRFKRDRIRGVNVIRPCWGFFSKRHATTASVYERPHYFVKPRFAEPVIEEYFSEERKKPAVTVEYLPEIDEDTVVENLDRHGIPFPKKVDYPNGAKRGDIIVESENFRLYYILNPHTAIEYHIAVGKDGFAWSKSEVVSKMAINPDWRPTPRMRLENESLPALIKGGTPENPMGARAIYLGETEYRIHGTNHRESIGMATSSGCFRMFNEDVVDLYDKVKKGARVYVYASEPTQTSIY